MSWLELPALKWFLPIPVLALLAWPIWRFFRASWAELEAEALQRRQAQPAGAIDWRPALAAVMGFIVLALQYYHGTPDYFAAHVRRPLMDAIARLTGQPFDAPRWGELAWECWWGFTRIGGYLLPVIVWRLAVPGAHVRELGLRGKGFREHLWIYAACVAVMVPVLHLAQRQPDFGAYYPFYDRAGRSWVDFLAWEAIYLTQFFALELFFRGWWIGTSRSLGVGAIFAVTVPYASIHLGKPYFEALGALVAGVVLGSLAVRTRSIWAGFLVHSTIALLMDVASLRARHALPSQLAPGSQRSFDFPLWTALPWLVWCAAVAVLLIEVVRRRSRPSSPSAPARARDVRPARGPASGAQAGAARRR